jgi:hypothetical protein
MCHGNGIDRTDDTITLQLDEVNSFHEKAGNSQDDLRFT